MGQMFQGSLKLRFFPTGMPVSLERNILISFLWSTNLTESWEPHRVKGLGGFSVQWIHFHLKVCFQYTASYLSTALPDILRPALLFKEYTSSFCLFYLVGTGLFIWLWVCRGLCWLVGLYGVGKVLGLFTLPYSYFQSNLFSASSLTSRGSPGLYILGFSWFWVLIQLLSCPWCRAPRGQSSVSQLW